MYTHPALGFVQCVLVVGSNKATHFHQVQCTGTGTYQNSWSDSNSMQILVSSYLFKNIIQDIDSGSCQIQHEFGKPESVKYGSSIYTDTTDTSVCKLKEREVQQDLTNQGKLRAHTTAPNNKTKVISQRTICNADSPHLARTVCFKIGINK